MVEAGAETRVQARPDARVIAADVPNRWVWAIAGSGVAPFIVLVGMIFLGNPPVDGQARLAMIGYGAVVLGFVGGARWGAELVRSPAAPNLLRLVGAAVPTAVAWAALVVEPRIGLGLLIAAGVVMLAWDVVAARSGLLPAWTEQVRTLLTAVAVAAMGLALVGA